MRSYTKDADAELDYGFNWSDWLQDGESISSSNWTITGDEGDSGELTIMSNPTPSNDGQKTKVWLEDGVFRRTYRVTNSITTDQQRKDERSLEITITQK